MSMSTRCQVWCLAVEKLASLQQAPGRSACRDVGRTQWGNPSLPIAQVVEIMSECADMVTRLPPPLFSSVSPGPGREVRNGMGWSLWGKGRSFRRGRSLLFLRVLVHTCLGEARLSGHNLESGAGHCLIDCGGLSLP